MELIRDRMLGCLYGQAIGDALGLGTEFLDKLEVQKYYPNGLSRYEEIIQDAHRSRWPIGAWTDDTDMMLCILGAKYGCEAIPRYYIDNLHNRNEYDNQIQSFVDLVTSTL